MPVFGGRMTAIGATTGAAGAETAPAEAVGVATTVTTSEGKWVGTPMIGVGVTKTTSPLPGAYARGVGAEFAGTQAEIEITLPWLFAGKSPKKGTVPAGQDGGVAATPALTRAIAP